MKAVFVTITNFSSIFNMKDFKKPELSTEWEKKAWLIKEINEMGEEN